MATKRAYKLQEFVAHASDVNCVKFGRRTSRILITGGEDQKVNLWVVGKPSMILSLSGLTSPVESVSFDSSEVMIGAGAASGTIKIWDVEEAKVVRTFTGHRSNCASLDFHPFGEFFASGSSDTNMKIWDLRKKGCIHTYKGHTRRIDVLRFTPDGRWIVSGGADNSVKVWDLTAGKLLNDFRLHKGPVNCLDFHPHEFLLATGSADKTVKFWDFETFELIGSSGPEASVVRSMIFNSDGKSLFCGLHENLKVLSWEPIVCHDVLDVRWPTLADLNVLEGKLLGCSYYQSCVGIWVVDLMQIKPYAVSNAEARTNGSVNSSMQDDNSISSLLGRLSVTRSTVGRNLEFANMNRRAVFGLCQLLESSESHSIEQRLSSANYERRQYAPTLDGSRRYSSVVGEQNASASDEDAMADLMENHQEFIHLAKSRLTKLEVVYQCWQNNDIKGCADVMRRMSDHAVIADIISALMENTSKYITLDICASILALASSLLESIYDRHMNIGLEMILKLVKCFGATISSTLSSSPPVSVDLEAEKRLERCKLCFEELNKVNANLASLTRRQGEVGRSAQELSLSLQDIFQLPSR